MCSHRACRHATLLRMNETPPFLGVGAPPGEGAPEGVTTPNPDQWRPDGVWCRGVEAQVSPIYSPLTHMFISFPSLRVVFVEFRLDCSCLNVGGTKMHIRSCLVIL